jgi:hypothetical protein
VLDGFLRRIAERGDDAPLVWAVPLANIDGIEQGDYGKDNFPIDMNRAWGVPARRHETLVYQQDMRRFTRRCRPVLALDFHSPGACENEGVYLFGTDASKERARYEALRPWADAVEQALGRRYAADPFLRVADYPSRWEFGWFTQACWALFGFPGLSSETPYGMIHDIPLTQKEYQRIGGLMADAVCDMAGALPASQT